MPRPAMHDLGGDEKYIELDLRPWDKLLDGDHDEELGRHVRRALEKDVPLMVVVVRAGRK